jgi:hypothetical protein
MPMFSQAAMRQEPVGPYRLKRKSLGLIKSAYRVRRIAELFDKQDKLI